MNEKWFALDVSSVEKKLKTNAASGLSPTAARSRSKKSGAPFFITEKKSPLSMLGEIVADASLILLIICSVMALCFTEYTSGITLTVIIILNIAAALFFSYKSGRLFESIASVFAPSCIVIRSGKAFSVSTSRVVVGDVVLLSAGDVIGFDARLVTSDSLRVKVRVDRKTFAEVDKFAEGSVRENENDIRNMTNMLHAGSIIISGGARAIVTATGRNTYYGAMTGGVDLQSAKKTPHGLTLLRRYCSGFGFAVMGALLPFCILTLLFSKGNITLMTSFSAALAIAASSMAALSTTACKIFFAKHAISALDDQNPVAIRGAEVMDELVAVEYLLLLDGSAVTDGVLHYYKAICADGELKSFDAVSPSMKRFAELVAMYDSAEKRTLTTGIHAPGRFSGALCEFVRKNAVDTEALGIRCSVNGYVPASSADKTDKLFFVDMGRKQILHVTDDPRVLALCNNALVGNGVSALSDVGRQTLAEQFSHYSRLGMKVLLFSVTESEFSSDHTLAGMLVLSEAIDNGFESAIAGIEALGVKTISFTSSDRRDPSDIPAPTLKVAASASDFTSAGVDVTYRFGEIDTYRDLTLAQIDKIIGHIHSLGKKVAVLCFSDAYTNLTQKPDVFVTCSALQYKLSGHFEETVETIEVPGGADSSLCRQDIKCDADIIIPRPSKRRGGLLSLRRAFLLSGAAYNNLIGFFRYVLCSQFVRIFMVMLPMLFSESHLDARHALLCGFLLDIGVMMVFVREKCGVETARGFRALSREFRTPIKNNAGILIAASIGGLLAVILPAIMSSFAFMGGYFYQTESLFISMVLLHVALMFCVMIDNLRRFGKAELNKTAVMLCTTVITTLILCFLWNPLSVLLDIREITLPYLMLTPIPAVLCAILYFLLCGFTVTLED